MKRRNFLASASAFATAGALGLAGRAAAGDSYQAAFDANRATQPWTLGFAGLQDDAAPMPLELRGRLPQGLQGALFRNGPARHALGGERYHHWFDGDGMVQKYSLGPQGITHQGRFVRTEKFLADSAAGRPVRQAFGTRIAGAQPLGSPDAANTANTSLVQHAGELMALWEGGSATRIDPLSLATLERKAWAPELAGMPFSAHPKVEPDGTLWNFGLASTAGMLAIYRVKPSGELARAAVLRLPDVGMVHDFAVTERHLVFLVPPLVFERARWEAGESFLDSHLWKPQLGLRVLVLEKDDLEKPRWFELPAGFVFHIGNAWEDRGTIRLDCMRSPSAWPVTTGFKEWMRGQAGALEYAELTLVTMDLRQGRARQIVLPHRAEFPRVDARRTGRRYSQVFAAERVDAAQRPGFDAVLRVDIATGKTDRYRYGADVMVEEHVFVPNPAGRGREGEGWLLGTALDLQRREMLLSVFDAQRLADGPVAQARMPRAMPLGFHGIFVPA